MTGGSILRWLAVGIGLLAGLAAVRAQEPAITIGVRVDTPPFAWQDEDTGAFRGYLTDLCIEATTRAGFHFNLVPIDAAQRALIINGDPTIAAKDGSPSLMLDLLCDPTTISLARLQTLIGAVKADSERLVFSPIVFVANGSYVWQDGAGLGPDLASKNYDTEGAFAKATGAVLDGRGCNCLTPTAKEKEPPPKCAENAYFRAAFVTGTTAQLNISQALKRDGISLMSYDLCPEEMPSHEAMVAALCRGDVQYAFGDTDIALFYSKKSACKIVQADRPLSYEPYALLISDNSPGFRPRFIAALYEMFSDQTVSGRFGTYFPGLTKSSALSILFRINSIPGMRDLQESRQSAQGEAQGGGGGQGSEGDDRKTESAQK